MGFAVGAIPLSEILAYCQLTTLDDPDERRRLIRLMRALDGAYLAHVHSHKPPPGTPRKTP